MTELDCRNLACPMPIVKISRAMRKLSPGDDLEVTATDPAFEADVRAWVRRMGQELVSFDASDGRLVAVIRKV